MMPQLSVAGSPREQDWPCPLGERDGIVFLLYQFKAAVGWLQVSEESLTRLGW